MGTPVRVARLDDVPENGNRAFKVGDRDILVSRTAAGVFASGVICSHQHQSLEGGKVKAVYIFCPAHGVRFDLRDGCPTGNLTKTPIPVWPATVDEGWIFVDLDEAHP